MYLDSVQLEEMQVALREREDYDFGLMAECATSQFFQNLFRNAAIHGKPNKIEVKCISSKETTKRGNSIIITNDGKQIPYEIREKIFKKGFTTSETGTGFGLYIVKKLCEAHSWEFGLDPKPKTTFNIFIPKFSKKKEINLF